MDREWEPLGKQRHGVLRFFVNPFVHDRLEQDPRLSLRRATDVNRSSGIDEAAANPLVTARPQHCPCGASRHEIVQTVVSLCA